MASVTPRVLLNYDVYAKLKKQAEKPPPVRPVTPEPEKPSTVRPVSPPPPLPLRSSTPEPMDTTEPPPAVKPTQPVHKPSVPPTPFHPLNYDFWHPVIDGVKGPKKNEAKALLNSMVQSELFSVSPYGHLKANHEQTTIKFAIAFPALFSKEHSQSREAKRLLSILRKLKIVPRQWTGTEEDPTKFLHKSKRAITLFKKKKASSKRKHEADEEEDDKPAAIVAPLPTVPPTPSEPETPPPSFKIRF